MLSSGPAPATVGREPRGLRRAAGSLRPGDPPDALRALVSLLQLFLGIRGVVHLLFLPHVCRVPYRVRGARLMDGLAERAYPIAECSNSIRKTV